MVCTYLCGQIKNYAGGKASVLAKALSSVFLWAAKYTPGSLAARRKFPCPKPRRGSRLLCAGLISSASLLFPSFFFACPITAPLVCSHRRENAKQGCLRIARISRQAYRYAAKTSAMQIQQRNVIFIRRRMVWIHFGQKNGHGFRHAAQRFLSQADLRNQQIARLLILDKFPDRAGNQMVPLMVGMDAVHAEIFPKILLGEKLASDVDEARSGLPCHPLDRAGIPLSHQ